MPQTLNHLPFPSSDSKIAPIVLNSITIAAGEAEVGEGRSLQRILIERTAAEAETAEEEEEEAAAEGSDGLGFQYSTEWIGGSRRRRIKF